MASPVLFIAFIGGLLPSLLWLLFWLLEDRCEPEPKKYLFLTFLVGMFAVVLVLPFEKLACLYLIQGMCPSHPPLSVLFAWAILEELFKIGAAVIALRSWALDEPIDAIIYMVTAALGFAAMENALFLLGPLHTGNLSITIVTGDLRFIGATLLHILASATVGLAMALAFYRSALARRWYFGVGVILAVALHTTFNFLILTGGVGVMFSAFICIWAGIVAILLFTEKVKLPARDYC